MARLNVLADVVKGLKANIYAVDNLSPVSRIAVYVKAGSRYEPDEVPGISHYMKAAAGLSTRDSSIFGIARHIEKVGASLKVTNEREHIVYRVNCLRDKIGLVLGYIDDTLHKPEFRSWELSDHTQPSLNWELKTIKADQDRLAMEALHKAAYRGGLAHPTYMPEHQVKGITKNDLMDFHRKNFVLERMFFVGMGVDLNELTDIVEGRFSLNPSRYEGVNGESRYSGGESRIQANFPRTMVNYVVEGLPITDNKGLAALELVSALLGDTNQVYMKYGNGPQKSVSNLLASHSPQFKSRIININHSDTGLFGISIIGPNVVLKEATKAAAKHVVKVLSNFSENDLKHAKKAAKARSLIHSEDHEAVFHRLCNRFAVGAVGQSPLELLEKVTLKEVQDVCSKLIKKKPTIVSVGNPRFVPYLDEIEHP